MKATIRNIPDIEILVHTVSVKKTTSENVYLFRCYRCGTSISQVKGEITRIFPGLEPSDEVPVISQCFKCHWHYTFQTKNFVVKPYIELGIVHEVGFNDYTTFHCVICRSKLLNYNQQWIERLSDSKLLKLPHEFICSNDTCNRQYKVVDVL